MRAAVATSSWMPAWTRPPSDVPAPMDAAGDTAAAGDGGVGDVLLTACAPSSPTILGTGASVSPAVSWDGTQYAVVWGDARTDAPGIYLRRLDAAGLPMGAADVLVGAGTAFVKNPEIAKLPGAAGHLVVWEDCAAVNGANCDSWLVNTRVLDGTYAPVATVQTLSPGRAVERRPYVLFGLGKTFVTYRDAAPGDTTNREWITVFAVDAAGAPLAVPAPRLIDIPGKDARFPFLAANQTNLALVYVEGKNQSDVVLTLLDANLAVVRDVKVRQNAPGEAYNPQAAWMDNEWVVAWEDARSGSESVWLGFLAADATSVRTTFSGFSGNSNWPVLGFDGNSALLAFHAFPNGAQVIGQEYTLTAAPLRAAFGISPLQLQNGRFPAVLYNASTMEYAVVYVDRIANKASFVRVPCPN